MATFCHKVPYGCKRRAIENIQGLFGTGNSLSTWIMGVARIADTGRWIDNYKVFV